MNTALREVNWNGITEYTKELFGSIVWRLVTQQSSEVLVLRNWCSLTYARWPPALLANLDQIGSTRGIASRTDRLSLDPGAANKTLSVSTSDMSHRWVCTYISPDSAVIDLSITKGHAFGPV